MFLEVIKAYYIKDFKLLLGFNNGVEMIVDLENELNGTVFTQLNHKDYFKKFSIHFNTVEWENGADFAPEFPDQIDKQHE